METKEKEIAEVQGTETKKKEQKPSATYTLTQFGEMIKKLIILKLITAEEAKTLDKIRENVKAEYIKQL